MTVFETFVTQKFNENNLWPNSWKIIPKFCKNSNIFIKYCEYPWFWLLTGGGPAGHTIDLNSEFLLGIKIAHVWEENESLVISICGLEVHEIGTYKKSLFVGHPVEPWKNKKNDFFEKNSKIWLSVGNF